MKLLFARHRRYTFVPIRQQAFNEQRQSDVHLTQQVVSARIGPEIALDPDARSPINS